MGHTCQPWSRSPATTFLCTYCVYSKGVWTAVIREFGLVCPAPADGCSLLDWWKLLRLRWPASSRKLKDSTYSLFAMVTWQAWKERNCRCFRSSSSDVTQLLTCIREVAELWVLAGARDLGCLSAE
ncbi:hypothetical protein BS78_08G163700 [Paspalum vaginatum]|nr:hypothetical protein BS78_08G163700 [Paspalum vaginatum]